MRNFIKARFSIISVAISFALAACTVGPKYVEPQIVVPKAFDQAAAQTLNNPVSTQTFQAFGSAALDGFIARALAENTSILQAAARLDFRCA